MRYTLSLRDVSGCFKEASRSTWLIQDSKREPEMEWWAEVLTELHLGQLLNDLCHGRSPGQILWYFRAVTRSYHCPKHRCWMRAPWSTAARGCCLLPEEFCFLCPQWHSVCKDEMKINKSTRSMRIFLHNAIGCEFSDSMTTVSHLETVLWHLACEIHDVQTNSFCQCVEHTLQLQWHDHSRCVQLVENRVSSFGNICGNEHCPHENRPVSVHTQTILRLKLSLISQWHGFWLCCVVYSVACCLERT